MTDFCVLAATGIAGSDFKSEKWNRPAAMEIRIKGYLIQHASKSMCFLPVREGRGAHQDPQANCIATVPRHHRALPRASAAPLTQNEAVAGPRFDVEQSQLHTSLLSNDEGSCRR